MSRARAAALAAMLLFPGTALAQPDGPTKQTVELATGITMAYVEAGELDSEPVILLHGFTDTSRSFLATMDHLVERAPELRVLAVDQRGHGASSMPPAEACRTAPAECFRIPHFAADVIAFMDALGLERAHLVGHSLGSLVAQEVALANPERVRKLVLIGSTASTRESPVVHEFLLASLIEGPWKTAALAKGLTWPDGVYHHTPAEVDSTAPTWMKESWVVEPLADPALIAQIQPETEHTPLGTWLGVALALTAFDNTARLKDLAVPTFVIWGIQDTAFPEADQVGLRAALSGCRAGYVWKRYGNEPLPASGILGNEIGHNVQWGAPDAVAADIAQFIREGRPTPDLYYGDPTGERRVLTSAGEAELIEPRSCPAPKPPTDTP